MLVSGQTLLDEAVRGGYAIGSFNTYNLEITRAILAAAEARRSAVFLAVGSGALDYGGFAPLTQLVLAAAREATVPVAVHLDHSPTVADCERCLSEGFTSLMIDGQPSLRRERGANVADREARGGDSRRRRVRRSRRR